MEWLDKLKIELSQLSTNWKLKLKLSLVIGVYKDFLSKKIVCCID